LFPVFGKDASETASKGDPQWYAVKNRMDIRLDGMNCEDARIYCLSA